MTQFKLENHNAVTLLNRLRVATHETTSAKRRVIYNGLSDALKGLGLIEAKGKIEGIYEGVDRGGNHWFMVDMGDRLAEPGVQPAMNLTPAFKALHQAIGEATGAVPPMEEYAILVAAKDVILNAKDSIVPSRLNPPSQAGVHPDPVAQIPMELVRSMARAINKVLVEKAVKEGVDQGYHPTDPPEPSDLVPVLVKVITEQDRQKNWPLGETK